MIRLRAHHLRILYWYIKAQGSDLSMKNKDQRIIKTAVEDGHSKKHGLNVIKVMKKALNSTEKIKLVDTLDDICKTCNDKHKRECREFIQYGTSLASEDRGTAYFYGLKIGKTYNSNHILRRLREREGQYGIVNC